MSLQAYSAVWADKRLKNGALIVAMAIADFAWDDGWAFPSVDTIAEKARLTPRRCIQVIAVLEEMGLLVVIPGGGWKGTNLYGLTALTKGEYNPPTPSEIESAMRTKRQPLSRRRANAKGEKISGGVKKFQGESVKPKISPEPLEPLTPPKQSVGPGPVEWPSQDDILREASNYPGSPARAIPAKMPEAWALDWWAYCTFRRQQFAPQWKQEFVFRFERDWQDGNAKARGVLVNGHQKGQGVWELNRILEQLKKREAQHPANESSSAYLPDVSDEDRQDLANIQANIKITERRIAEKTMPPAA